MQWAMCARLPQRSSPTFPLVVGDMVYYDLAVASSASSWRRANQTVADPRGAAGAAAAAAACSAAGREGRAGVQRLRGRKKELLVVDVGRAAHDWAALLSLRSNDIRSGGSKQ